MAGEDTEADRKFTYDRVAFVVAKKRLLEIEHALAEFAAGRIDAVAALQLKARKERRAWEKTETVVLSKKDRAALVSMLGKDVSVPRPGTPVRRAFLRPAVMRANRFERARELFPPDMLENEVSMTRAEVAAFDPASPMPKGHPAVLPGFPPKKTGVHTTRTLMLNSWLEGVLEDSFVLPSLVTVTFEAPCGPVRRVRLRGADRSNCYRGEPIWTMPPVLLARSLDNGRVIAGTTGGPITYMFAGDPIAKALDPKIAVAAKKLAKNEALVAFTFIHTDVLGGDWNDRK